LFLLGRLQAWRNLIGGLIAALLSYFAGSWLVANHVWGNGYATTFFVSFVLTSLGLTALQVMMREPEPPTVRARTRLREHPAALPDRPFHEYRGNMVDQIIAGNVIGTSTVVYRFEKFPTVRFRQEFRRAGEDYLFWLELATRTTRFAFSTVAECRYGRGVNVFSGSTWGTDEYGLRLHEEMKYRKAAAALFPLSGGARHSNQQAIRALREGFITDALHRLRHRKAIDGRLLVRQLRLDPWTAAASLSTLLNLTLRRQS
jgi:succinoglycan biosynthesis protein ExoW